MEIKSNDKIIRHIAREAAREAVKETLSSIGFDITSPQEVQADIVHLRKLRRNSEYLSLRIKSAIIAVIIPAFLYLLWEVIRV